MSTVHRNLDEELKKASAGEDASIQAWSASERSDELLARLHDKIGATGPLRPPQRESRFRLPIWVAAGVVLVIITALVVIWLVPNSSRDPVVIQSTTSSGITEPQVATKGEVIESIATLFEELPGFSQGDPGAMPSSPLETARLLGLITKDEAVSFDATEATTRLDFAVWIWRAWRWVLPPVPGSPAIADLDGLDPEEVEAIRTMVALEILRLDESRAFSPKEPLTSSQETEAFATLRELLEKR